MSGDLDGRLGEALLAHVVSGYLCSCGQDVNDSTRHCVDALRPVVDAEVARVRREALAAVRDVHAPFGIYVECEHRHTDDDVRDGTALDVDDVGLTCGEGLLYYVCQSCCRDGGGYQTEECATGHPHGPSKPICETAAVMDGAEAAS